MNRRFTKHILVGLSLILLSWGILGVVLSGVGFGGVEPMAQDLSPSLSTEDGHAQLEALSIWIGSQYGLEGLRVLRMYQWMLNYSLGIQEVLT
jgi:hypothetical protein